MQESLKRRRNYHLREVMGRVIHASLRRTRPSVTGDVPSQQAAAQKAWTQMTRIGHYRGRQRKVRVTQKRVRVTLKKVRVTQKTLRRFVICDASSNQQVQEILPATARERRQEPQEAMPLRQPRLLAIGAVFSPHQVRKVPTLAGRLLTWTPSPRHLRHCRPPKNLQATFRSPVQK